MSAATMPMHFEREQPGILGAVLLAALVHALLFSVLGSLRNRLITCSWVRCCSAVLVR